MHLFLDLCVFSFVTAMIAAKRECDLSKNIKGRCWIKGDGSMCSCPKGYICPKPTKDDTAVSCKFPVSEGECDGFKNTCLVEGYKTETVCDRVCETNWTDEPAKNNIKRGSCKCPQGMSCPKKFTTNPVTKFCQFPDGRTKKATETCIGIECGNERFGLSDCLCPKKSKCQPGIGKDKGTSFCMFPSKPCVQNLDFELKGDPIACVINGQNCTCPDNQKCIRKKDRYQCDGDGWTTGLTKEEFDKEQAIYFAEYYDQLEKEKEAKKNKNKKKKKN